MFFIRKLNSKFVVQTKDADSSVTIASGVTTIISIPTTKSGYTPKGIIGIYFSNTDGLGIQEFFISQTSGNAGIVVKNTTTSSITTPARVYILYEKN